MNSILRFLNSGGGINKPVVHPVNDAKEIKVAQDKKTQQPQQLQPKRKREDDKKEEDARSSKRAKLEPLVLVGNAQAQGDFRAFLFSWAQSTEAIHLVIVEGPSGCGKTTLVRQLAMQLGFDVFNMEDNIWRESLDSLMFNQTAMQDTTRPKLFVLDPADERDDQLNAKTTKFVTMLKSCTTKLYPIVCICSNSYRLPFKDLATVKNVYMQLPKPHELREYLKFQMGPRVKIDKYMDWNSSVDLWTLNKRIGSWHEGSDYNFSKTDDAMDLLFRKTEKDRPELAEFLRCLDGTDVELLTARMHANYPYYVLKTNVRGLEWLTDQLSEADVLRFCEESEVPLIIQTWAMPIECTTLKNQIIRPANRGQEFYGVPFVYPETRKKAPSKRLKLDDAECFLATRFKE